MAAYTATRYGAGHFGTPAQPSPSPYGEFDYGSSEARSGAGHFNPQGGTSTYIPPPGSPGASAPYSLAPPTPAPGAPSTYGSESGPGIMQQWFNQRASGTDPGWEYATGRGLRSLDNAAAARGNFNSGASLQNDSDFMANMASQREGQLDQLAAGASGERANSLSTMLGFGNGIAGAGAGLAGNYDLGAANAMNSANASGLQLATNAAMIPYQANQGMMQNMFGLGMLGLMR